MLPGSGLAGFALALMVAAGSPGPSIGALVARVLTRGFRSVLPFLAAMWLGELLWLTVAVTGLAAITSRFAFLLAGLKLAGAGYLLWLAWQMWVAGEDSEVRDVPEVQSGRRTFLAGMMITLGNPKIAGFYLALLPSLVKLGRITVAAWGELALVTVVVLAGVDLGWSALAVRGRPLLLDERSRRMGNRVSAGVMAGAAVLIAVR